MKRKAFGHNGSRAARVTVTVPQDMVVSVKKTATYSGMTVSALIQAAITLYFMKVAAPSVRAVTADQSTTTKLNRAGLLNVIRKGITACSTAGRRRGMCRRAAYARYCLAKKRLGQLPIPYLLWCNRLDEFHLVRAQSRSKTGPPEASGSDVT